MGRAKNPTKPANATRDFKISNNLDLVHHKDKRKLGQKGHLTGVGKDLGQQSSRQLTPRGTVRKRMPPHQVECHHSWWCQPQS
jgi:hypothetical protein